MHPSAPFQSCSHARRFTHQTSLHQLSIVPRLSICTGWGCKCQLLPRSSHSCVTHMAVSVMVRCHFAISFSFSRESFSGWSGCLTCPFRLACCKKRCGESTQGLDGLEETSRGCLIPVPCPTSAPTSVISVRGIIISPGLHHRIMKRLRWDLEAHPVPAPLP